MKLNKMIKITLFLFNKKIFIQFRRLLAKTNPKLKKSFTVLQFKQSDLIQILFINNISNMQSPGIRKNIQALTSVGRQRFFWCLKGLGILPAFKANQNRYFHSLAPQGFNKVYPKSLHDELIASHATTCEHNSIYFAYYHRHLMVYYQMQLNFVDEVFREGAQRMKEIWPKLYEIDPLGWDQIFQTYRDLAIKDGGGKVMAHYWNPTNYRNSDDLIVPIELSDPDQFSDHKLDKMDQMYKKVKGSYYYEINTQQKWFQNSKDFKEQRQAMIKNLKTPDLQYFVNFDPPIQYTDKETQIIKGKLTPRSQLNTFYQTYVPLMTYRKDNTFPKACNMSSMRNFKYFEKGPGSNQTNMKLLCLTRSEILVCYGGKQLQMQWIKRKEMGNNPSDNELIKASNYNQFLPHYRLGKALLHKANKYFSDYINPENNRNIQNSHNIMHNNMYFSLMDGNFSLMHLMFFPYHSWIDAQLQLRIRMDSQPDKRQKAFKQMKEYLKSPKLFQQYFDYILYRHSDQKNINKGQYPIMEWANPQIKEVINALGPNPSKQQVLKATQKFKDQDVVEAFKARDYILTDKTIRRSNQLSQIYRKHYLSTFGNKFKNFHGLEHYEFNYDYEIYETLQNNQVKLTVLSEDKYYIPQYLEEMDKEINRFYAFINWKIGEIKKQSNLNISFDQKAVRSTLKIIGTYPSILHNGSYTISASFPDLDHNKFDQQKISYLKEGFDIFTLLVNGKGNGAQSCIKCAESKHFIVDISEQIYMRFPLLWQVILRTLNDYSRIVYDSKAIPKLSNPKPSEMIELRPQCKESITDLRFINGAERITFKFENSHIGDTRKPQIKIHGVRYYLQNGSFQSIVTKQSNNFTSPMIFQDIKRAQLASIGRSLAQFNGSDEFIYIKMMGTIKIGEREQSFDFKIRSYHLTIQYLVIVEETSQSLHIRIQDNQYQYKKLLYEGAYQFE